jgi:hypothetical protein
MVMRDGEKGVVIDVTGGPKILASSNVGLRIGGDQSSRQGFFKLSINYM